MKSRELVLVRARLFGQAQAAQGVEQPVVERPLVTFITNMVYKSGWIEHIWYTKK